MKYRKLGSSDLEVSEISLGSWLTYGVGVEAEKARACLDEAFAVGIYFIDTANVYGRGAAETVLGEALKDRPRDSYVLSTKIGRVLFRPQDPAAFAAEVGDGPLPFDLRFDYTRDGVHRAQEAGCTFFKSS